jgi:hypothetical protein
MSCRYHWQWRQNKKQDSREREPETDDQQWPPDD